MTASRFSSPAIAAVLWALLSASGSAADYYWDTNGSTSGFGTAGGTWGSSSFFSTSSSGTLTTTAATTTSTDSLAFGTDAAGFGLASGTVTVSGSKAIGNMSFGADSGAVTLTGGTLGIGASTVTASAATSTISSRLRGTGSLTKTGTGVLILDANNDFSGGSTVSQGMLQIGSGLTTGSFTGAMSIANGATLRIVRSGTLSLATTALSATAEPSAQNKCGAHNIVRVACPINIT